MSQGLVQAKASASGGSGSPSITFTNNVAAGDLLVAAVSYNAQVGQPAVSDTLDSSWIEVGEVSSVRNGNQVNLILFWALATSSGADTITADVSGITGPTDVWMAVGEFSGVNELALISGSTLGYGVSPNSQGQFPTQIQATTRPLTTPTGALLVVAATTSAGTATWSVDVQNNWYSIAAQGGGIVLAFATNLYSNAPFCDLTPPEPILDRSGDSSLQWVILTAPFTTTILPPLEFGSADVAVVPNRQYPPFPYEVPNTNGI